MTARGNFNRRVRYFKRKAGHQRFSFWKEKDEDYASFKKIGTCYDELSPVNRKYIFDSVGLFLAKSNNEQYDRLDNLQTMFSKGAY